MATPRRSNDAKIKELALALQASDFSRVYLESSLLATDDLEAIAEVFDIPLPLVVEYERTLYPVVHLNRLQKLEIVSKVKDSSEAELKRWAITQGFDFIKWRLGFKVEMSPVESMISMYSDCYFKSKEAFYSPNASVNSKEALKWVRQAAGLAQILKTWVVDSKEAKKDIELALAKVMISQDTVGTLADFEEDEEDVEDGV